MPGKQKDSEKIALLVLPLMIGKNLHCGAGRSEEVDACTAAPAPRYDAKKIDLGEEDASLGLAVVEEPPNEMRLVCGEFPVLNDFAIGFFHAA